MSLRYVWSKWNRKSDTHYAESSSMITMTGRSNGYGGGYAVNATFEHDSANGRYIVTDYNMYTNEYSVWQTGETYIFVGENATLPVYANRYLVFVSIEKSEMSETTGLFREYSWKPVTTFSKGTTSYGNVSSASSGSYPSDNYSGSYWYTYKGNDTIDPVSVSYIDPVSAGHDVTIEIAPSTGNVYGGNISYIIQTTTDGENWYDVATTTETTYTLTVPADAIVWNVRVQAKDDTGFTSSTYVYGNGVETYVDVIRVGISPDSGDIGFITSPRVMYLSINTENEYTLTVSLNGTQVSSVTSTDSIQSIMLTDEQFAALEEYDLHQTVYTLGVDIVQGGATVSRTYTFKKFSYDEESTEGVWDGIARALRIKRQYNTQIVGKNAPKEIIKVDNPVKLSDLAAATASEAQVFSGFTFFSGDSELKTGTALGEETSVAPANLFSGKKAYDNEGNLITGTALSTATTAGAGDILSGKTAYNNLGQLLTGTMSRVVQAGTVSALQEQTYTVRYENNLGAPKLVIAWFSLDSINSFSPYTFQGAVTGAHAGTSISGRSGSFRNQNQSMANSTYTIGSSSFSFTVDKYDYMGGGSYECSYIFVW